MVDLTAERLRSLLDYDPLTGILRWKAAKGGASVGAIAGSPDTPGYVRIAIDGKRYPRARLAWLYVHGEWPSSRLDHRDVERTNDSIENLRPATVQQNSANRTRGRANTSGHKGVYQDRRSGRWRAHIVVGGRFKHLGTFSTRDDAARAYGVAATHEFGEFAKVE